MALSECDFCRRGDPMCFRTATFGKPIARIVASEIGAQSLAFPSIDICRAEKIAAAIAKATAPRLADMVTSR